MKCKRVAVIGAGLIGQAWALVFARAGCEVMLWDEDPSLGEPALRAIESLATSLGEYGLIEDASDVLRAIHYAPSLERAVDSASHVQENVVEDVNVKRAVFRKLDALAEPAVVIASSTSGIPTSRFSHDLPGRARCLVAHPANPPYLLPVVEISGAPWTSPEAINQAADLMHSVGQRPVVVRKEVEGFVLNRLQGAVLREAFRLVQEGYVDPDGLDTTFRDGLGLRWAFMGPFETIDLNAPGGLVDYCARYGELYRRIAQDQGSTDPWPDELIARLQAERRDRVPAASLGARRLWRDRRLMALAAHKARQSRDERED